VSNILLGGACSNSVSNILLGGVCSNS